MRSGRGRQVQEEPAQVTRGKPISNVVDKAWLRSSNQHSPAQELVLLKLRSCSIDVSECLHQAEESASRFPLREDVAIQTTRQDIGGRECHRHRSL